MELIIDDKSGFCFGVKNAINLAEQELKNNKNLFCLGDIVHNDEEVKRLADLGLVVISREKYFTLKDCVVLLRAHGEPPSTYNYAKENNIKLIDGTCPVVLKLQNKILKKYNELNGEGTIVIFGKSEHPEVIGLLGQVKNNAVVVLSPEDIDGIDFSKPVIFYAQTTMNKEKYWQLKMEIENRLSSPVLLEANDTICGQVANRGPYMEKFANSVDAVVFVGGKKSSNSKVLFSHCKETNQNSFFVSTPEEAFKLNLSDFETIGVCGATSTPQWLLDEVGRQIEKKYSTHTNA